MATPTVPQRIRAGPTCYEHFTQGKKDLYAPDFLLPGPPPQHVWRYGVATDRANTIFFHNEASKKSVWVLPVVDAVTGESRAMTEQEVMRAEGAVASARSADDTPKPAPTATKPTTAEKSAEPSSSAGDADRHAGPAPSSVSESAAERPRPLPKNQVEDALRNRLKTKQEIEEAVQRALMAKAKLRSDGAVAQPGSPPQQANLSVEERLAAYRARRSAAATAGNQTAVKAQEHAEREPPAAVTSPTEASKAPLRQPSPQLPEPAATARAASEEKPQHSDGEGASSLDAFVEGLYAKRKDEALAAAEAVQREKLAALEEQRLAYERQRRRQAEEEAEEAERLRLLRTRRLVELEQLEQAKQKSLGQNSTLASKPPGEDRVVDAVNDFLESQAATLTKAEDEQRKARTLEESIARALANYKPVDLNPQPARATDSHRMPAATADSATNASHMGARGTISVLQVHQPSRQNASVPYGPEYRYMGDITTNGGGGKPSVGNHASTVLTASTTRSHPRGVAGVDDESENGLARLLSTAEGAVELPTREGEGTMHRYLTISQRDSADPNAGSYFKGTWVRDERDGHGTLSLPHTVAEGTWHADALAPASQLLLQTQQLKGVVTTQDGGRASAGTPPPPPSAKRSVRFEGPAMLELANGARVAGTVTPTPSKRARAAAGATLGGGPCAIHLPSRDRVEWWPDAEKEEATPTPQRSHPPQRSRKGRSSSLDTSPMARTHSSPSSPGQARTGAAAMASQGTGKCRVHFHSGDVYVGSVANYQLHGYGRYEFRETGNVYIGGFFKGFMQGEGTYYFADGDVYVGDFFEGAFHGVGCYVHKGHYVYKGEWHAGQMHGRGIVSFANGDTWKGVFAQDRRVSGRYVQFST